MANQVQYDQYARDPRQYRRMLQAGEIVEPQTAATDEDPKPKKTKK